MSADSADTYYEQLECIFCVLFFNSIHPMKLTYVQAKGKTKLHKIFTQCNVVP